MLLMELLKRNGLEGGRDVVLLSMGVTPARYGALLSGSVDAAILVPPLSFMAEAAGYRQLVSFIEQEFIELTGAVIARQGLLQSDPALAEKFVRATVKGLRLARENRSAAISFLMRHTKTTEELAAKVYDICRPGMTNDGTVEESVQRRVLETAARNRGLQEIPSNDRVFDFSMAKKSERAARFKKVAATVMVWRGVGSDQAKSPQI
jgi:ABC-type nitrate/sulfonate/bicarbonate transport system substrate-binding protein